MTRANYADALDTALVPLGFVRDRNDWTRVRNDVAQVVVRNVGSSRATSVQLFSRDIETEKLYLEIYRSIGAKGLPWVADQSLLWPDGRSRWWTSDDPEGPATMTEAVLGQGLAWFERIQTLEDQAEIWFGRSTALTRKQYNSSKLIVLALTLCRMGRFDEASAVIDREPPFRMWPEWLAELEIARAWIAKQVSSRS
jgi:hypothetical protein